jgi:hypothetical protein
VRRRGRERRRSVRRWHYAVIALVVLAAGLWVRSERQAHQIEAVQEHQEQQAAFDAVVRTVPEGDESHPPNTDTSITSVNITAWPSVERAVRAGVRYWHRRSKTPCAHPRVYRLDRLTYRDTVTGKVRNVAGTATFGGCVIWVDRAQRKAMSDGQDCALLTHELGHTASLTFDPHPPGDESHSVSGLMSPDGGGVIPGLCSR